MTSTIKRRIAREWLIFLAAIILGLLITYGVFYLGRKITWESYSSPGEPDRWPEYLVREIPKQNPTYGPYVERDYAMAKNPGDMFNDLWRITSTYYSPGQYHEWDEQAVKLWLCVLSPYFVLLFVRSIIWSVNTIRRP